MAIRVNQVEKAALRSKSPILGKGLDQAVLGHGIGLVHPDVLAAHHPHPALVAVDQLAEGVVVAVARPSTRASSSGGTVRSR